jgi:hypothetical protein
MITEGQYDFPAAYIGGTFNPPPLTLYTLTSDETWSGTWAATVSYQIGDAVAAYDGNVYVAVAGSTDVEPPTDNGSTWVLADTWDLTDYTAIMPVAPLFTLDTSDGGGLTLGGTAGTITIIATPEQTALAPPAALHYYIQLTDGSGNVYYPVGGSITFVRP